jgi:two-component system nitrogen regulation sensor histidine kinase GlnL
VLICIDDESTAKTLVDTSQLTAQTRFQSSMASILAHEIKNPLAGIKGAAQLLQKCAAAQDKELTVLISSEVDRIKNLIEEIEFFSNPPELKTEAVNIHEVLHYAKSLTEKDTSATVDFVEVFDPTLPPVQGNRNHLVQLFINLFKNAIEANDYNAKIEITTSYKSGVKISTRQGEKQHTVPICITISDNGPGVPADLRNAIFDPFVTTKKTGKGLGLAIVTKIITDHGGMIELDTPEGGGAKFAIYLPVFRV